MSKDPNYLDKVEKAIVEKYGEETIQSPKANWTQAKELDYIKQYTKKRKFQNSELKPEDKIETAGVLMPKKLFIKETNRVCISCNEYSFKVRDDLYMTKFRCCWKCYINFIEGREEKWLKKWIEND